MLDGLPPRPAYYARMKALNSRGPMTLGQPGAGPSIASADAHDLMQAGHVLVDLRNQTDFGRRHASGAVCIGGGKSFSMWAAWMLPYDTPLLLMGTDSRH